MEQLPLASLSLALEARSDVCSSHGPLTALPSRLLQPFHLDYIGIVVCHEGHLDFRVNGTEHTAREGETMFLTVGVTLQMSPLPPGTRYSLLFYRISTIRDIVGNNVITLRLYDTLNPRDVTRLPTTAAEHVCTYISLISSTPIGSIPHFEANEQRLLLLSLTYRLCSLISNKMLSEKQAAGRKVDTFVRLITLISAHYRKERTVAFYADKLCLTPKYLSTLVRTLCGYTVQDLITKAVMRRALFLVTNTNNSIQSITDELSFPNPSAFGTYFKKHTGKSPKNYRESNPAT